MRYVFGGVGAGGNLSTAEVYDPAMDRGTPRRIRPSVRCPSQGHMPRRAAIRDLLITSTDNPPATSLLVHNPPAATLTDGFSGGCPGGCSDGQLGTSLELDLPARRWPRLLCDCPSAVTGWTSHRRSVQCADQHAAGWSCEEVTLAYCACELGHG